MSALPDPASFPERPPSEVEWEELLVRLEIAPRALRLAVEQAPEGDPSVADALRAGVRRERDVRAALDAMREGREAPPAAAEEPEGDAAALLEELSRLRARSFAVAQRRGLDVWGWRARGGPFHGATANQLLHAATRMDRALLERIRGARGAAC